MSAYILVEISAVKDADGFNAYREKAPETVAKFGGQYEVVGGDAAVLEGDWKPGTVVLLKFPDRERAESWWKSTDYRPLKEQRQQASESTFVLLNSLA